MKCRHAQFALTLDHVLPYAAGGRMELGNLQLLCERCNGEKSNQHIDYRPFHPNSRPVPTFTPGALLLRKLTQKSNWRNG